MQEINRLRRFRRLAFITVLLTVFLICVGGWVRSTGSGMGCPDWPKCFDMWIPPTDSAQLPANYLAHYVEMRQKKNIRVAKILDKMGFSATAEKIKNDPSVFEHEAFNTYKTWTEYINRLIGVLVGLAIFATLVASFWVRKTDASLFWLSFAAFVGVGFEGWLGSIVVSTNLMPGFITVHMFVALLILVALIAAVLKADDRLKMSQTFVLMPELRRLIGWGIGICVLIAVQIVIGTQVREAVDLASKTLGDANRARWIEHLGTPYKVHQAFYYVLAVSVLYWAWLLRKKTAFAQVSRLNVVLVGSLLLEIALGIGMHRLAIPPIAQPLHLMFATILFAAAFSITMFLFLYKKRSHQ